jgi:phosphatidylglycerol:prolipoprotein diacylglycerol transferase
MYPVIFEFPAWIPVLGGEPVTSFGVMMFLAFVTAGIILRKELDRMGYPGDKAWDFVFMAVIGGIVGAKLYYVLLNYDRLSAEGLSFVFSRGGMVWYGGFLGAAALVAWEARRSPIPVAKVADASGPAIALAYAVGRIGCFLVGDDYGRPTDSWVGIRFPNGAPPTQVDRLEQQFGITVDPALVEKYGDIVPVHPTQLYEVAMSTLIFLLLWRLRRHTHSAGWLFMLWLTLAGAERFIVEIFRAKDDRFIGMFTLAQVISVLLVMVGIWGMQRLHHAPAAPREAPVGS